MWREEDPESLKATWALVRAEERLGVDTAILMIVEDEFLIGEWI